jgi:tRNA (guanosine-2'-O-)-methyltransferase
MNFSTPSRFAKIDHALTHRQPGLTVVLENIHDSHNVNAILRSCDAVGVMKVHLVYTIESYPKLELASASGADKWLEYERHATVEECFTKLRAEGYQILATKLEPSAKQLYDFDLSKKTALVLGNEHRGISDDVVRLSDSLLFIPMMGMAESLNVSVATAVCLFEALRQRRVAGIYDEPQLSPEALRSKRLEWQLK